MTEKEIEILLHEMVEEKFNSAFNKLITFKKCEEIYNELCMLGYSEEMQTFKNIVLYTIILEPEITEEELLIKLYKEFFE